ncbi:MAG: hypothetical protein LBO73_02265, partial [Holosporaceae bacterium]|nr:hypothetical protein [Holosporaceae bacterium]
NIKNNRCVESEVTLITDTNSTCKIIKKDFEFSDQSDSSSRKLQLKPNESKELHFRIRMDERNGTENLS